MNEKKFTVPTAFAGATSEAPPAMSLAQRPVGNVRLRLRLVQGGSYLLASFFLGWTAYYLVTTLLAIANFAWRQPMFDQWREYATYLSLPFPDNVIQNDNGHRPIIPNLIRVAEIHWFAASQLLQILVGTACAVLTTLLVSITVWRQREMPLVAACAGIMLATLGIFWLANARMLLHGNESLHVFIVTLSVTCASLWTYQAHRRHSLRWFGAAAGACVVAMFSFGAGVASFPAIILLGFALRLPARWLLIPATTLIACLAFYLALPGDDAVRGMVALHPVDGLIAASRWLSSPWINGWLGFADPTLYPWMAKMSPDFVVGHWLRASATLVVRATGIGWRDISAWIGLAGMLGCGVRYGIALFSRRRPEQLEVLMLGVGLFALATACVIGVGRVDYLAEHPDQLYADRYLVWPSLFWMSMAVLLLRDVLYLRKPLMRSIAYLSLTALPIALLPTHFASATWVALVYRNAQANAAAVESGVYDEEHFPGTGLGREPTLQEIGLLREKRIGMFADAAWIRVGTHWTGILQPNAAMAVNVRWLNPINDPTSNRPAGHMEGWAPQGVAHMHERGRLAILTEDGVIAGLAEWSFIRPNAQALLLSLPRKRGFDGYVHNVDLHKTYTLALLDFAANSGFTLATLPAQTVDK